MCLERETKGGRESKRGGGREGGRGMVGKEGREGSKERERELIYNTNTLTYIETKIVSFDIIDSNQ